MTDNRPTKKQRELLNFIDGFVKGNGYGPSYREIMRALGYKSVSTVAVHVDGLITHGLLRKTDNSARSLEIVRFGSIEPKAANPDEAHTAWLEAAIKEREAKSDDVEAQKELATLQAALNILSPSE